MVFIECSCCICFHPVQVMVDLWKERGCDGCCKIVCEHFFGPYVIKPVHGNTVSKPHVSGFMCYQLCSGQFFIRSRVLIQEKSGVIVKSGTGVLHSSKLESRKNHEIIFGKRIGHSSEVFLPFQGIEYLLENCWQLCYSFRVCFPTVCSNRSSVFGIGVMREFTCCKSKEVGA